MSLSNNSWNLNVNTWQNFREKEYIYKMGLNEYE